MTKIQNFKMYIDGQWVESESGKTIETLNPENNEVWATVPEANAKDVDNAVKAAQNAFENSCSISSKHPIPNYKNTTIISINIFFIFCMMNSMIHRSDKYFF